MREPTSSPPPTQPPSWRRAAAITLIAVAGVLALSTCPALSEAVLPVRWRPLHVVTLTWVVLVLGALPRDLRGLSMLAAAAAARLALYAPNIHLHTDKAYALMDEARGQMGVNVQYGDAYAALCSWVEIAYGAVPDLAQRVDAVAGGLTVAMVMQAVRMSTRDDRLAAIAALLMALNPLHVAMSSTEERMVLVTLAQAAFVAGAARRDTWGDALSGLSAGLVAHLRPEQALIAALLLGALVLQRGAQAKQSPPPASEALPQPVGDRDPLLHPWLTALSSPSARRRPGPQTRPPTRARTSAFAVTPP